jgi:hypothetical protein
MSLEINFIDYNKVTNTSDAFITCDELNCYVQYLSSTITTAPNIKKDKHTAGTTEDVHDFKIPDVKDKISPKKLKRINPFNKNHNEVVYLNKLRTDPDSIFPVVTKEIKTKEIDFAKAGLNQDQIDFLLALQNLRSGKIENDSKLLDIEQFQACKDKVENNFFDIGARFYESMVSIGGGIGGFDGEVVEQTRTMDPAIDEYIKKYNLPQADTSVKKKFNVRKGNATGVNQYLQDSTKKTETISKQSNTQDFKQINVTKSTQKTTSPIIKLSNSQNYTYQSNILNSTHSNSLINNIKVSKVYNEEKQNFKDRYDDFVKLLNSSKSNQKVSFEIKNFNTKQYNNTEYKEVINLTERNTSSFVMNNLSSNYNFYREMNNRYSEFKTDFISYSTEVKNLTNFTIKNRNTINQLYKTQNTFRQSIMNVINNIRKIEKITFNENDNEFKYNILKFVKQSTFKIENTVSNVKNELNQTRNNISFVNHKLFRLENFKDEYFSKEVLNFLNTSENFVNLNRFASSTLNNYAKNNYTKTIQSLSLSENQINNIIKLSEIKNINNENIESITKVLNIKLGDNQINNLLNLSKIDNKIIQKISSISKIENINKNILNITEQEKIQTLLSSLNISQVQNLKMISTSVNANEINKIKNVINTTENIDVFNLSKNEIKLSKEVSNNFIQELNQISKVYNTNSNNFRRIVKINSINQQTIDNIEVINSINQTKFSSIDAKNIENLTKVVNVKLNSKEITNLLNLSKVDKNLFQKISSINKIENINNNVLNVSEQEKVQTLLTSLNISQIKNLKNIANTVNVNKIKNILNSTDNIDLVNLSKNEIRFSKEISSNFVQELNQLSKIYNSTTSKNYRRIVKLNSITQQTLDNVEVFNSMNQTKLSNFVNQSRIVNQNNNTNVYQQLSQIENKTLNKITLDSKINYASIINKINKSANKIEEISNLNLTTQQVKNIVQINKINKSANKIEEISNLNLTTQQVKNIVQLNKISQYNKTQNLSQINENIFKVLNISENKTNILNSVVKLSNVENKNITQLFDVIEQVKKYDFSKISTSKIDFSSLSQNINNLKTISQYDVKNISVIQNKISNFSDRRKLKETIELLNITTKNNIINPTVFKVTNSSQRKVLQENIQNINIFESGKNATVINKLSFESNKKNITNLVSDLNIVNNNIFEKRTSQNINQVYKELNLTNKDITKEIKLLQKEHRRIEKATNNFVRTISKQNNLATQNVYDYLSFTNNNFVSKTNIDSKYGDYSKIYTLLNNSKVINQYVKSTVEKVSNNVSQTRIVKQVENIRFDLHKTVQENNFKLENYNKITSNNYFEQKEVESKQEKIIETKVEQLLVKKIENVTNSLVKNVMTKNEFTLIKNEIVNEILQIQIKQEDKLKQFRLETQQTVQDMLERFLRS